MKHFQTQMRFFYHMNMNNRFLIMIKAVSNYITDYKTNLIFTLNFL